jgi:uncharacterized protein (TIGR03437 family)
VKEIMRTIEKSLFCLALGLPSIALGDTVIVPNGNIFQPGNASSALPGPAQSIEFQVLLGGGQFHSSPITIGGISFRAKPGAGPLNGTIANLTVTLSTSPNFPNTNGAGATLMSSTFANNVGKDKTVVFTGSNVPLKDSGCAAPAPCPFDINLVFQTPFTYSPTSGALLIDMVETNVSGSGALDAVSFSAPGGSVATVVGTSGSATGTFAYQGPVVQVMYTTTAPSMTGVVNVASSIPPGMANYGIAQGSLFAIYGSNLGPSTLAVSQVPLSPSGLSGTALTVGGTGATMQAPVYFTRSDVVVGVMPSNMPPGNGNITVTYNGKTGTLPVTIMQSNFGISNNVIPLAGNGIGIASNAAVTFSNYQTVTTTNTAKPGDTLVIWGTGLGATPNGGGDTGPPPAGNIGSAPQVFVGGVASPSISYWGRAPGSIPGLDQINFQVPTDAPLGCNISVVVQTSNGGAPVVSNAPTIALSDTDGATCSDPLQVVPTSYLSLSSVKVLYLQTQQQTFVNSDSSKMISSKASALIFQATQPQLATVAAMNNIQPSLGTCYVGINSNPDASGGPLDLTLLNAGTPLTLTPPSGAPLSLTYQNGGYDSIKGSSTLAGGTWSFSNGSGGPDVGPLSFNFTVPQPVAWMNRGSTNGNTINRASPYTILWSGGDSNGYVDIQGYTQAGSALSGTYFVGFECSAPVSAGQFTIPPSILMAMPGNNTPGTIQVSTYAVPNTLGKVPGFDAAVSGAQFQDYVQVLFK